MHMLAVTETKGFHLDPRTKLLLMAVVATAEFLYGHTAFMLAVALIPFILLLTNRQYKADDTCNCQHPEFLNFCVVQHHRNATYKRPDKQKEWIYYRQCSQ